MKMIERSDKRGQCRWLELCRVFGLFAALAGCAGESAKLVSASDVANCKPLGEVTASVASKSVTEDRAAALRNAATEKGATDVVSEGDSTSDVVRGQAYDCGYDRNGKQPSRSEQRAGF